MKTSEFIKTMENYGYTVEIDNDVLCLVLDDVVMTIHEDEFGAIDTQWSVFTELEQDEQEKILEVAFEYIMTPIKEREEPKKYYLKLPIPCYIDKRYLNREKRHPVYFFSDNEEYGSYQTKFTQEEIDEMPNQDFIQSLIKEEVK